MKNQYIKLSCAILTFLLLITACNKDVEQFPDIEQKVDTSGNPAIATIIASEANLSLYNEVVKKSGYADTLNNKNFHLTIFAPINQAVKTAVSIITQGQIPANAPDAVVMGFIQSANFPETSANALVKYNTIYQDLDIGTLTINGLNNNYPNMLNPAPDKSPLARLSLFVSKTAQLWYVNNVPIVGEKLIAGNGSIYPVGALVMPPQKLIWNRITDDLTLTYFKAAVEKADEGLDSKALEDPTKSITGLLNSFGPNITVFAPTDSVFKATLTLLIAKKMIDGGLDPLTAQAQATALASTPGVFKNEAVASILTSDLTKGLLAYHILPVAAFTNNFPMEETRFPTIISLFPGQIDPGLKIKATFSGPGVSALTVRGAASLLPVPANVWINPLPDPIGSSDQLYANGTINKINQILLPTLDL